MSAPQPNASCESPSPTHDVLRTVAEVISSQVSATAARDSQSSNSTLSEPKTDTPASGTTLSSNPIPPSWLWLRGHDQAFVGACVAVFLLLSGFHWAKLSGWGAVPLEIDRQAARRYDYQIDINSADLIEWTQIEGIGEATAQRILDDRAANGPFRNIADLQRVKGIGPATASKIRPFVRDGSPPKSPATPNGSPANSD